MIIFNLQLHDDDGGKITFTWIKYPSLGKDILDQVHFQV